MTPKERIEEAHGLWELAVARLAAFAELGAKPKELRVAVIAERFAFQEWERVSKDAIREAEKKAQR